MPELSDLAPGRGSAEEILAQVGQRHPGTLHILQFFAWGHLPNRLRSTSQLCAELAQVMVIATPDGPELTVGLRKLLEAKDCFVRAML